MPGGAQLDGLLARLLAVMALVGGAYNPSGYSYYHWILNGGFERPASKIFVGLVIGVGLAFCYASTLRSLRLPLLLPALGLIVLAVRLLNRWGWIDLANPLQRTLVIELSIVLVFTLGLAYSTIRFRLTGQYDSRYLT